MTATPMTLEDALRHQGYTIDLVEAAPLTLSVAGGTIHVPAQVRSVLTWRRFEFDGTTPSTPELGDDLFLGKLPLFSDDYRPVLLSSILDRYRTRRIGYNTPGEFRLAVRRWGNLNMAIYNQRYVSTGVTMPLDDRDALDQLDRTATDEGTSHALVIGSDFPQSLISGDTDYASTGNDRRQADNASSTGSDTTHRTGRDRSIMELLALQREQYLNVDAEVIEAMEGLFLGVFDQGEGVPDHAPYGPYEGDYGFNYRGMWPRDW